MPSRLSLSARSGGAPRDVELHQFFEQLVPALDPPTGPLPDAERLVALAEGRLSPGESRALLDEIRQSSAARTELRALYPDRHAALLGEVAQPAPPAKVLAFPARRWWAAGAALAAAAALVIWLPARPPEGGGAELEARSETVRGGQAEPGDRFHLRMHLGRPGLLDRVRGRAPWGALFQADPSGVRLVCTSADLRCRSAGDTLSWTFTAPMRASTTAFAFVTAGEAPDPAALDALTRTLQDQRTPEDLAARLEGASGDLGWQVHRLQSVEVR